MVLASSLEHQQIALRRDSNITLTWNYYVIEMRMVDLLVLRQTLDEFSAENSQPQSVLIRLNELTLNFTSDEFSEFHALVCQAAAELPRQIVRWADLKITIHPHQANRQNGLTQFSIN